MDGRRLDILRLEAEVRVAALVRKFDESMMGARATYGQPAAPIDTFMPPAPEPMPAPGPMPADAEVEDAL